MKVNMTVATLVMIALALAGTLLFGGFQEEPFEIGDWSGVDIVRTEAEFAASGSNEDLVLLVKALCWRLEVAGDESAREPLLDYGQELLDRAKAETVDLETVDDPDVMLQVLRVVRQVGAK